MHIAIIGAGAAGCFAAISLKRFNPGAEVTVYESGNRPLAKVAITGGGRCNLTNSFGDVKSIAAVYPRGERLMKRLLQEFSHSDAYEWFEREGVKLVTQADNCVFPQSQNAMEIVDTLTRLMTRHGVNVKTRHRVKEVEKYLSGACSPELDGNGFRISFNDDNIASVHADKVIVTTGGSPRRSGLGMLGRMSLDIVEPVPSLFGLTVPNHPITELTGTVVEDVVVSLVGTKHRASGALLITHWGMSGPAILRLSSYAARTLHQSDYKTNIAVNWFGDQNEAEVTGRISAIAMENPQKMIASSYPRHLNSRLWRNILEQSGINPEQRWAELSRKSYNRLVSTLTNSQYLVGGKNRFKEEFVTCGGVALGNVDPRTLECRTCPGLYFAGEVLDVDAVTGGFNLQAAWTMGYVAAKAAAVD